MEGLAQRLTRSFLRRGIITAEQTEWCAYILECKLDQWSAFAVMAVVGTVLAGFPQTVLFLWGICQRLPCQFLSGMSGQIPGL